MRPTYRVKLFLHLRDGFILNRGRIGVEHFMLKAAAADRAENEVWVGRKWEIYEFLDYCSRRFVDSVGVVLPIEQGRCCRGVDVFHGNVCLATLLPRVIELGDAETILVRLGEIKDIVLHMGFPEEHVVAILDEGDGDGVASIADWNETKSRFLLCLEA